MKKKTKRIQCIHRDKSIMTQQSNLEQIYSIQNFPVYMGCTDQDDSSQDIVADMNWGICKDTGVIQLLDLVPLEYVYQNQHCEGIGKIWQNHYQEFVKFVDKFKPQNVLEIGGGNGWIGSLYKNLNPQSSWTILDANPTVEDHRIHVIKGWFNEQFDFPKAIDTVVHSHLLEHLYNPVELLLHIFQFLQSGSKHIFTFPNLYEFLKNKYTNCLNFEHTIFLTEEIVDWLLEKIGFEIVEKQYFMDHSIFYSTRKCQPSSDIECPLKYDEYKKMFMNFINYHLKMVQEINDRLQNLNGNIYLFGAHIFSQYLIAFGLKTQKITAILDNGKIKQGKRLYGTNLKVFSPQIIKDKKDVTIILKAANYNEEIKQDILNNINKNVIFI